MAMTGPLIVISGLSILAIISSQLHKIVTIFDKKPEPMPEPVASEKKAKLTPDLPTKSRVTGKVKSNNEQSVWK